MVETLETLFGKSARVLVKDGEFNEVQGEYHHYDYSQRITNDGSYNIIGNTIHNVGNICPQVIYHSGRVPRSMRHNPFAPSSAAADAIDDASPLPHSPQFLVPIPNNLNPLLFAPQTPGNYVCTQSGDIRAMTAVQTAFMDNQMAHMIQEIDSEFSEDNEEQNLFGPEMFNASEDDISVTTTRRSQSLSADFSRLTIEEHVSSESRSVVVHGSSSTTVRAAKSPRHITISGDHTEVDNNVYQTDFDSHKEENNIIINSFGEGNPGDVGVWQTILQTTRRPGKLRQTHKPGRR